MKRDGENLLPICQLFFLGRGVEGKREMEREREKCVWWWWWWCGGHCGGEGAGFFYTLSYHWAISSISLLPLDLCTTTHATISVDANPLSFSFSGSQGRIRVLSEAAGDTRKLKALYSV